MHHAPFIFTYQTIVPLAVDSNATVAFYCYKVGNCKVTCERAGQEKCLSELHLFSFFHFPSFHLFSFLFHVS